MLPKVVGSRNLSYFNQFTESPGYQVIQVVTFLSPIVGGHQQPLKRSRELTIPFKRSPAELLGNVPDVPIKQLPSTVSSINFGTVPLPFIWLLYLPFPSTQKAKARSTFTSHKLTSLASSLLI